MRPENDLTADGICRFASSSSMTTDQEQMHPTAPSGLYARLKALPFAGTLRCDARELEAGSWHEILLDYEVGSGGIADSGSLKITFKFYSDWALFQTTDPQAPDFLSAEYLPGDLCEGQQPATVRSLALKFDQKGHERPFQKAISVEAVDGYLNAGDRIVVRLGDRRRGSPGTRTQTFVDDDFRFRAYVDTLGTSRFVAVPNDHVVAIVAGPPARIAINNVRVARSEEPVPVHLSLLDRWGNAVRDHAGSILLKLDSGGGSTREELLPLCASGWATTSTVIRPKDEVRLQASLRNSAKRVEGEGVCTGLPDLPVRRPFLADLHVHAHDTVGTNSPAYNARYARDIGGMDVFGYTANDFQITDAAWRAGVDAMSEICAPGDFVTFPVQEWCGSSTAGGDHKVIFLGDHPPQFPYGKDGAHNRTLIWNDTMSRSEAALGRWPVEELWSAYEHASDEHLIVPHVGGRRYNSDWHHPQLERLIEVASTWGHFPWLYQDVIARGYQLGVCANSDEHRGRPGGGSPGVQVFGVNGGVTGVLAEELTRASVGRALRARHTYAIAGGQGAGLVRCGKHLQGDAFTHAGHAELLYRFLGAVPFDEVSAFDHTGRIWHRDLHQESGYSPTRVRIRWGGARVKDRYRWAAWNGTIQVTGATLHGVEAIGFEHDEERIEEVSNTQVNFRSETYGDADAIEFDVTDLSRAIFKLNCKIGGFTRSGDLTTPTPFADCPTVEWELSGAELLERGRCRRELGGVELFVAIERLSDEVLSRDIEGSFTVDPRNAAFGFRPVYFFARQRNDAKVWTSAHFIHFES